MYVMQLVKWCLGSMLYTVYSEIYMKFFPQTKEKSVSHKAQLF